MNNFLTRLVARNSPGSRPRAESTSIVKPRIGSRFESDSDLSGGNWQGNKVEENGFASQDHQVDPDNSVTESAPGMHNTDATGTDNNLKFQNEPAATVNQSGESVARDTSPMSGSTDVLSPSNLPEQVIENSNQQKGQEELVNEASPETGKITPAIDASDHRSFRQLTENSRTDEISTAQTTPASSMPDSRHHDIQQSSFRQQAESSKAGGFDATQSSPGSPMSDTRQSDTLHAERRAGLTEPSIQRKSITTQANTIKTKVNSMPAVTHQAIEHSHLSRPILSNDSSSAKHEPVTAATIPAVEVAGESLEQDIPDMPSPQHKSVTAATSIINSRITLTGDSRDNTSVSDDAQLIAPIIHGAMPGSPGANQLRGNPLSTLSEPKQAAEVAQPPVVKVSIGRIEIRATSPAPQPVTAPQRTRRGPAVSLSDYLKSKGGQ